MKIKDERNMIPMKFDCSFNNLESLEDCPEEVGGNFICRWNNKAFTDDEVKQVCKVKGRIFSYNEKQFELKKIKDFCKENNLEMNGIKIYNFIHREVARKLLEFQADVYFEVQGDFDCSELDLTSLKGCPRYVGGNFICYGNKKQFTKKEVKKLCSVSGKIINKKKKESENEK
jgi:hypothetical protein